MKGKSNWVRTFPIPNKRANRHGRGRPVLFTPYWIASHPGYGQEDMQRLAARAKELDLPTRQLQDFTPTPGTLATAMYVTGLLRDTLAPIPVARTTSERRAQRQALEASPGSRPKRRQR